MNLTITNRARRIGRHAVASRYNSERERAKYISGKYDNTAILRVNASMIKQAREDK